MLHPYHPGDTLGCVILPNGQHLWRCVGRLPSGSWNPFACGPIIPRSPFTSAPVGGGLSCPTSLPLAVSFGSMSLELWGLSPVPLEGLGLK